MKQLNLKFLDRISPFYLLLDEDLQIVSAGRSALKVLKLETPFGFKDFFEINRPKLTELSFNALVGSVDMLFNLVFKNDTSLQFRGQFEYLEDTNQLFFIGSPWFGNMDQVLQRNLTLSDFAVHDPIIDVLHILQTNEMASNDLKALVGTINKQKVDLKKAAEELNSIALVPRQNPDPIYRIKDTGEVIFMNPSAENIEELCYDSFTFPATEIWQYLIKEQIIEDNKTIELSFKEKIFSFRVVFLPTFNYFNIYGRDITENKKYEEQLKTLSLIANNTTNGVIITNRSGLIEWGNKGFEQLTGYLPDEYVGKKPGELLQGEESEIEAINTMREALKNGTGFHVEIVNYHKNGSHYWVKITSEPIYNENGEIERFFALQENVTVERRSKKLLEQKEEKYRSIISNINLGLVEVDMDETIQMVNKGFESISGYTAEEIIGKKTDIFLNKGAIQIIKEKQKLRNELKSDAYEIEVIRKDGEKRFWLISGAPLINDSGMQTGSIGIHLDITDRKIQEKRLQEVLISLRDANRELNDFAYIVSHDLKAPLRAISTLAAWLESDYADKLDDEGKEHIQLIIQRANRMHNLIEGILKYSKVGKVSEKESVNTKHLLNSIIDSLAPDAKFEIQIGSFMPVVHYTEIKLQQIFQNLISNAIKFNDKAKGVITIDCKETETHYEFSVYDNGPGIPTEFQERVFKIFQTLKSRDEYESTGIGLTIVKKIIESNGGEIWINNDVKEGTMFCFTVPKH